MSFFLVNVPSLFRKDHAFFDGTGARGFYGELSYLELVIRGNHGIENCRTYPTEALALQAIHAFCEAEGIPTRFVNGVTRFHRSDEETFQAVCEEASRSGPPVLVGLTGANAVFGENEWFARKLKERWPDVRILIGADFAALNYERLLEHHPLFDFVCLGEGERTAASLARMLLDGGADFDSIPGLAWRDSDGRVRHVSPVKLDLTTLPRPTRPDLRGVIRRGFGGSVYTSRGCPFRCAYCTTGQASWRIESAGSGYRLRDIEAVLDEVEWLHRDFGIEGLVIVDDLFLTAAESSRRRALAFAEGLVRRRIPIRFQFDCRVDSIDLDLFRDLARAGLYQVFVGVETPSPVRLESLNKRYPPGTDLVRLLRGVEDLGVKVLPGMIPFHADVSFEELAETLDLLDQLGQQRVFTLLNRVRPYPGTPLHGEYEKRGWLDTDWPIATYSFRDPRIRQLHAELTTLALQPGGNYDLLKVHLRNWIEEAAHPEPDP